jgi:hypothetical protein
MTGLDDQVDVAADLDPAAMVRVLALGAHVVLGVVDAVRQLVQHVEVEQVFLLGRGGFADLFALGQAAGGTRVEVGFVEFARPRVHHDLVLVGGVERELLRVAAVGVGAAVFARHAALDLLQARVADHVVRDVFHQLAHALDRLLRMAVVFGRLEGHALETRLRRGDEDLLVECRRQVLDQVLELLGGARFGELRSPCRPAWDRAASSWPCLRPRARRSHCGSIEQLVGAVEVEHRGERACLGQLGALRDLDARIRRQGELEPARGRRFLSKAMRALSAASAAADAVSAVLRSAIALAWSCAFSLGVGVGQRLGQRIDLGPGPWRPAPRWRCTGRAAP